MLEVYTFVYRASEIVFKNQVKIPLSATRTLYRYARPVPHRFSHLKFGIISLLIRTDYDACIWYLSTINARMYRSSRINELNNFEYHQKRRFKLNQIYTLNRPRLKRGYELQEKGMNKTTPLKTFMTKCHSFEMCGNGNLLIIRQ